MPLLADTPAALRRGAALFNDGRFWDAHEAWEAAWLEEDGDARLFLQGLIQVAAGFHKVVAQDQPRGCVKLLTSGLEKLRAAGRGVGGVDAADLLPRVEACLAEAHRWNDGQVAAFDRALIPRIRFAEG